MVLSCLCGLPGSLLRRPTVRLVGVASLPCVAAAASSGSRRMRADRSPGPLARTRATHHGVSVVCRDRVAVFFCRGRRPAVRHVGGAFVSFVALAASGGSPVRRAHSSPRPLDRARVTDNHVIVFSFVGSVFLDIPPNVV